MNIISTYISEFFKKDTVCTRPVLDIKQEQIKVLTHRFITETLLSPGVLSGSAMLAGVWWLINRREKLRSASNKNPTPI